MKTEAEKSKAKGLKLLCANSPQANQAPDRLAIYPPGTIPRGHSENRIIPHSKLETQAKHPLVNGHLFVRGVWGQPFWPREPFLGAPQLRMPYLEPVFSDGSFSEAPGLFCRCSSAWRTPMLRGKMGKGRGPELTQWFLSSFGNRRPDRRPKKACIPKSRRHEPTKISDKSPS